MRASIPGQQTASQTVHPAWSVDRKLDMVFKGMREHRPVRELCREAGISPTSYYHWQHQVMDAARTGLAHPETENEALKNHIRQLEAENASLRRQLCFLKELCVQD
jgi:transposase-like protein